MSQCYVCFGYLISRSAARPLLPGDLDRVTPGRRASTQLGLRVSLDVLRDLSRMVVEENSRVLDCFERGLALLSRAFEGGRELHFLDLQCKGLLL